MRIDSESCWPRPPAPTNPSTADVLTAHCAEFITLHGETEGQRLFDQVMHSNLDAITRRLGGDRHRHVASLLRRALDAQWRGDGVDAHREWIRALFADYYDPMYHYQRSLKADRIVFAGDAAAVTEWLRASQAPSA